MKLLLAFLFLAEPVLAKEALGLLPEVRIESGREAENQRKAEVAEVMITQAEEEAIKTLQVMIKKRKGQADEAGHWFRLAELYMRRAKSGRFQDLMKKSSGGSAAATQLRKAVDIYGKIEKLFPRFDMMDAVLFNCAFSYQQLNEKNQAEKYYIKLLKNYSQSELIPDTDLALGEMLYDSQRFKEALAYLKHLENYPEARVYPYGLYKQAWTYYNLRQNEAAIEHLIKVTQTKNLRAEALRDLTLFFGETYAAAEAYQFFAKLTTEDELGESLLNLGKLYEAHGRHKEINIFLDEFIAKNTLNIKIIPMHMLLISSYETLKSRQLVVKHLQAAADLCLSTSKWRKKFLKTIEPLCDVELAQAHMEIAKKWWNLWLKNKSHKEIADLTEAAFKIYLDHEDPNKPDVKSRYAYAELQFQLQRFRLSSLNYEIVFKFSAEKEQEVRRESLYSAMVALEKASEIKKEEKDDQELLRLGELYLDSFKRDKYTDQVQFKLGFINYNLKQWDRAEKWLRPLASNAQGSEFKRKSEDFMLDILNQRGDHRGIQTLAELLLKQTKEASRQQELKALIQENQFAVLQNDVKKLEAIPSSEKLFNFYSQNQNSELGKKALWQAVSILFSAGQIVLGADKSLIFIKNYPQDSRSLDLLKESAKAYSEAGFLFEAAQALEMLALKEDKKDSFKAYEAAADFYFLSGKAQQSQKIQDQLAPQGIEPFASRAQLQKLKKIFSDKKYAEAFQKAKTLVGSSAPTTVRSQARFVQAQILKEELFQQSTKSNLDRLQLVLGLKLEKLDKAQEAFLSAAKMSEDKNLQLSILQSLQACYEHVVESIGLEQVKGELSPQEKKELGSELAKLTGPILDKKMELEKNLKEFLSKKEHENILPDVSKEKNIQLREAAEEINKLIAQKKYSAAEEKAYALSRAYPQSALGTYYLGLIAQQQNFSERAAYLFQISSQKKSNRVLAGGL